MRGLSLTRRVGESCICLIDGKEIVVTVEDTGLGRVRLRFVADRSVLILRQELLNSKGDK